MLFHTLTFFVFFTITVVALVIARRHRTQKDVLLVASIVFYMWWNPAFILLIAWSTVIDYFVALRLEKEERPRARKALLLVSLVTNLGLLAFFKYANFLQDNLLLGLRVFGYEPNWVDVNVILPVGISFYTFQMLSYTIDVYRRKLPACRSFRDLALFVTFFTHLVAGPIVRAAAFLPQLERPARLDFNRGAFFLFLRGLVKKVIIADGVAMFADGIFQNPPVWGSAVIWMAALCFYVQIYCDFSGYTDMAIGLARMLGYELTWNFDRPYFSTSPADFWRRWHISLSAWLRDYVYIPLGGNRRGPAIAMRNVMLTMLLGGLWHGASWNFVLWGGLHGLALVVHRGWRAAIERIGWSAALDRSRTWTVLSWLLTQYWILLTWIPFRVVRTDHMLDAVRKFVLFDGSLQIAGLGLGVLAPFTTALLVLTFLLLHAWSHLREGLDVTLSRLPLPVAAAACVALGVILFLLWPTADAPFIYFQF